MPRTTRPPAPAVLLLTVLLWGCAEPRPESIPEPEQVSPACSEWGYGDETGPGEWGVLCDATCNGSQQSPIDIVSSTVSDLDLPAISFDYRETTLSLFNNGHTIEAADEHGAGTNAIDVDGQLYELLQFHFHALSEHTVDGRHSPIELHLVHRLDDSRLGVIGVMIEEGAINAAFEPVWSRLPPSEDTPHVEVDVDLEALLPADREYFGYDGSLTTPNGSTPSASCAEIVDWMVLKNPVEMSAEQIAAFQAIFDHNYRPVQALNGRTVSG